MRRELALAVLLLPLSGCYFPPSGPPAYAEPGYQQPVSPPPGYYPPQAYQPPPGYYPPPAYDPYGNIYPGYSYNGGSPTLLVEGSLVPLIFFDGGWGYYDGRHHWHHAPDEVSRHLEHEREAGGFRPGGAGPGARFEHRPEGRPEGGEVFRGQGSFRPPEQGRPVSVPAPAAGGFGGQGFFHPNEQGRPAAAAASAARPVAPVPAHEERPRGHECPPGQRC
jgi:hypothetical protein